MKTRAGRAVFDLDAVRGAVRREGAVVRVVVTAGEGSVPRDAGTAMLVSPSGEAGTIGGGALEHQATLAARSMLGDAGPWARRALSVALGPALGQCCGGAVRLVLERFGEPELRALEELRALVPALARPSQAGRPPVSTLESPEVPAAAAGAARGGAAGERALVVDGWLVEAWEAGAPPVWVWGAGHVGRALVRALEGLPLALTWLDDAEERFPAGARPEVGRLVVDTPAAAVAAAPPDATHYVLTYSHQLDLEICHRVLERPFGHLGLIGSATKRARFERRLVELGHPPALVARIECPIGDRRLGKEPAAIALGVATALLRRVRGG